MKSFVLFCTLIVSFVFLHIKDSNAQVDPNKFSFPLITNETAIEAGGDLSFPINLYNLDARDGLIIPITLNFSFQRKLPLSNSPSWVGYMWDMQIGSIVRSVNGICDDQVVNDFGIEPTKNSFGNGFIYNKTYDLGYYFERNGYLNDIKHDVPDNFSLTMPKGGFELKPIMFEEKIVSYKTSSWTPLDIQFDPNGNHWQMSHYLEGYIKRWKCKDENGTDYDFDHKNNVSIFSSSQESKIEFPVSWDITKIKTVRYADLNNNNQMDSEDGGGWVKYTYDDYANKIYNSGTTRIRPNSKNRKTIVFYNGILGNDEISLGILEETPGNIRFIEYDQSVIKYIETPDFLVEFFVDNYPTGTPAAADGVFLYKIEIYKKNNYGNQTKTLLIQYNFEYDSNYLLQSISKFNGPDLNEEPFYNFTYTKTSLKYSGFSVTYPTGARVDYEMEGDNFNWFQNPSVYTSTTPQDYFLGPNFFKIKYNSNSTSSEMETLPNELTGDWSGRIKFKKVFEADKLIYQNSFAYEDGVVTSNDYRYYKSLLSPPNNYTAKFDRIHYRSISTFNLNDFSEVRKYFTSNISQNYSSISNPPNKIPYIDECYPQQKIEMPKMDCSECEPDGPEYGSKILNYNSFRGLNYKTEWYESGQSIPYKIENIIFPHQLYEDFIAGNLETDYSSGYLSSKYRYQADPLVKEGSDDQFYFTDRNVIRINDPTTKTPYFVIPSFTFFTKPLAIKETKDGITLYTSLFYNPINGVVNKKIVQKDLNGATSDPNLLKAEQTTFAFEKYPDMYYKGQLTDVYSTQIGNSKQGDLRYHSEVLTGKEFSNYTNIYLDGKNQFNWGQFIDNYGSKEFSFQTDLNCFDFGAGLNTGISLFIFTEVVRQDFSGSDFIRDSYLYYLPYATSPGLNTGTGYSLYLNCNSGSANKSGVYAIKNGLQNPYTQLVNDNPNFSLKSTSPDGNIKEYFSPLTGSMANYVFQPGSKYNVIISGKPNYDYGDYKTLIEIKINGVLCFSQWLRTPGFSIGLLANNCKVTASANIIKPKFVPSSDLDMQNNIQTNYATLTNYKKVPGGFYVMDSSFVYHKKETNPEYWSNTSGDKSNLFVKKYLYEPDGRPAGEVNANQVANGIYTGKKDKLPTMLAKYPYVSSNVSKTQTELVRPQTLPTIDEKFGASTLNSTLWGLTNKATILNNALELDGTGNGQSIGNGYAALNRNCMAIGAFDITSFEVTLINGTTNGSFSLMIVDPKTDGTSFTNPLTYNGDPLYTSTGSNSYLPKNGQTTRTSGYSFLFPNSNSPLSATSYGLSVYNHWELFGPQPDINAKWYTISPKNPQTGSTLSNKSLGRLDYGQTYKVEFFTNQEKDPLFQSDNSVPTVTCRVTRKSDGYLIKETKFIHDNLNKLLGPQGTLVFVADQCKVKIDNLIHYSTLTPEPLYQDFVYTAPETPNIIFNDNFNGTLHGNWVISGNPDNWYAGSGNLKYMGTGNNYLTTTTYFKGNYVLECAVMPGSDFSFLFNYFKSGSVVNYQSFKIKKIGTDYYLISYCENEISKTTTTLTIPARWNQLRIEVDNSGKLAVLWIDSKKILSSPVFPASFVPGSAGLAVNNDSQTLFEDFKVFPQSSEFKTVEYYSTTGNISKIIDQFGSGKEFVFDGMGNLSEVYKIQNTFSLPESERRKLLTRYSIFYSRSVSGTYIPTSPNSIKESQFADLSLDHPFESISYVDGVGRVKQTQLFDPSTNSRIVEGFDYDFHGNKSVSTIPIQLNGAFNFESNLFGEGWNQNHALPVTSLLYQTLIADTTLRGESYKPYWGYSSVTYDLLGRPKTSRISGNSDVADPKKVYQYGAASSLEFGNYLEQELFKATVTDESGNQNISYTDIMGRSIGSRSFLGSTALSTQNIYNTNDQVAKVIPPGGTEYQYQYTYDASGKVRSKQMPNLISPELRRYDKAGQVRFLQTPNDFSANRYQYFKYDGIGQLIEAGIYTGSILFKSADSTSTGNLSTDFPTSNKTVLVRNYYGFGQELTGARFLINRLSKRTDLINISQNLIVNHYYSYDEYGRVEWYVQELPDGTKKKIDYQYNTRGLITRIAYQAGQADAFYQWYTYDPMGRLTKTQHSNSSNQQTASIGATYRFNPRLTVSQMNLGSDNTGGTDQSLDYKYYFNGFLTGINSKTRFGDVFSDSLSYYPNGNIKNIIWKTDGSFSSSGDLNLNNDSYFGFQYQYDNLNRLTSADYFNGVTTSQLYNNAFTFDNMGNILTQVKKKNNQIIDNLTYSYNLNQLTHVTDAATVQDGYLVNTTSSLQEKSLYSRNFSEYSQGATITSNDVSLETVNNNSTVYSIDGSGKALKLLNTTTTGTAGLVQLRSPIAVFPGLKYQLKADIFTNSYYIFNMKILWYKKTGEFISESVLSVSNFNQGTNKVLVANPPSLAGSARIAFSLSGTNGMWVTIDNIAFTETRAFQYDASGNLTQDINRNIPAINYNILNLPESIQKTDGTVYNYGYTGDAKRILKSTSSGSNWYIRSFDGSVLAELQKTGTTYSTLYYNLCSPTGEMIGQRRTSGLTGDYYFIKDYLGNIRVQLRSRLSEILLIENLESVFSWASGKSTSNLASPAFQVTTESGSQNTVIKLKNTTGYANYYKKLTVKPSTTYKIKFRTKLIKTGDNLNGLVWFWCNSSGSSGTQNSIPINLQQSDWQWAESIITSPATGASIGNGLVFGNQIRLDAILNSTGTTNSEIWIDDIELSELKTPSNKPELVAANDFYPFGSTVREMNTQTPKDAKYQYQSKEKDSETNYLNFGNRLFDSDLGRFFCTDKFAEKYYSQSPYQYGANNPISAFDENGDSIIIIISYDIKNEDGSTSLGQYRLNYQKGKDGKYGFYDTKTGNQYSGTDANALQFIAAVSNALDKLMEQPTGKALTEELVNRTDKTVQITPFASNRADPNGTFIRFNPNDKNGGPDENGGTTRDPFVALGHEMGHIKDSWNGISPKGEWVPGTKYMEIYACHIENMIRSEHGIPLRTSYGVLNGGHHPNTAIIIKGTRQSIYFDVNGNSSFKNPTTNSPFTY